MSISVPALNLESRYTESSGVDWIRTENLMDAWQLGNYHPDLDPADSRISIRV